MSGVTITAGWSFSGGITITEGPVPDNTAAWFGGGAPGPTATVARITFATDTATATTRGPLSLAKQSLAAAGNSTDGWFGGGYPGPVSTVQRITYATDTATASVRGPLSSATYSFGAAGNDTDAWFGGGPPPSPGNPYLSTVDRITYVTDTATASVRGPLSVARQGLGATGNSEYGWFASGYNASLPFSYRSTVDRITYANDTATASVRGPLNMTQGGKINMGAAGNNYNGWFGGGAGYNGSLVFTTFSLVDRITYATDTATASTRGPLTVARYGLGAAGGLQ